MPASRQTRIAAAAVFAIVLAVNLAMTPAGAGIGDEAEAQTVPYILGIAHPTGFPLYVLFGWLVSHALPFSTVAWRLNAIMAFATAFAASGVVLIAVEIGATLIASSLGALIFAFGAWVWYGALHANAQTPAATLEICALYASLRFARAGETRFLLLACACAGLGIATHPVALFVLPAIVAALAWQWRTIAPLRIIACIALVLVPLVAYAYMPLRAAWLAAHGGDPTAGAPVFGGGSIGWNMRAGNSVAGFLDEVLGRREGATVAVARGFALGTLGDIFPTWLGFAAHSFATVTLWTSAAGLVLLATTRVRAFSVLAAGTLGGIVFAYSYRTDVHVDRYAVVSFAIAATLAALTSRIAIPRVPARITETAVALLLAGLLIRALSINTLPAWYSSRASSANIVAGIARATPDGAIVIAPWNEAGALAYGAYAEHALGTRTIVAAWPYEFMGSYNDWTAMRRVFILNAGTTLDVPPQMDARPVGRPFPHFSLYEVESPRSVLRK